MYPVSDAFKTELTKSHQMVSKVDVKAYTGEMLLEGLEITEGNIVADKDSKIRRRITCTLTDPTGTLTPNDVTDVLHPLSGNEFYPYRGIYLPSTGTTELVPQGIFVIEDATIEDSGESLSIQLQGFDRSSVIQRNRFTEPYFVAEGTNYATAILNLIDSRMGGLVYEFMDTTLTTPPMVFGTGGWSGGGDPWEDAVKMAESLGAELFFDVEGRCVLRPEPDPDTAPVVWDYVEGAQATILYAKKDLTREDVFNHVIAYGVGSASEPIRVEALDNDPNSPTYVNGSFGDIPTFYRSTMLLTVAQAQQAADAKLRSVLGTPETVQFQAITNPAHQVGDVITITRSRMGLNASRHILDKITIPLTYSGSMNAQCRERRISA